MCVGHAGKDVRLPSALLEGQTKWSPRLLNYSLCLPALKPVRKNPGQDRACGATRERGRRKAARKGHQACPTAVLIVRQEEKC